MHAGRRYWSNWISLCAISVIIRRLMCNACLTKQKKADLLCHSNPSNVNQTKSTIKDFYELYLIANTGLNALQSGFVLLPSTQCYMQRLMIE